MDSPFNELPPEEQIKELIKGASRTDAAAALAYEKYARGEAYPIHLLGRNLPRSWKEAGDAAVKASAAARRAAKDLKGL